VRHQPGHDYIRIFSVGTAALQYDATQVASVQPAQLQEQPITESTDRRRLSATSIALLSIFALAISMVAIRRLAGFPYQLSWVAAWQGIRPVLKDTLPALLKVWSFWLISTLTLAALLVRFAPELGLFDSLLAGAAGLWVLSYLAGIALGAIGLLHPIIFWMALVIVWVSLWRNPPSLKLKRPTFGMILSTLSFCLLAISLLSL